MVGTCTIQYKPEQWLSVVVYTCTLKPLIMDTR